MLDVLVKCECTQKHRSPLLFVHGAYHAAWCWEFACAHAEILNGISG
jgi:hypothetical protein